jgi:hypothetical protein
MNPHLFLNQLFQYAALNNFAMMLDGHALVFDDVDDLMVVGKDGTEHPFPKEGQEVWRKVMLAGESPNVCHHPEHGWFVTHAFRGDPDEEPMRMVCWAEMGGDAFNRTACQWWKDQGADPGHGITDLHLREPPPPEPPPPPRDETRATVLGVIEKLGEMNPDGDPHGMIDPPFTAACRAFDSDRETKTPLTLEEWKRLTLTRETEDYAAAFSRDIADATDPLVFLAVLRDRLVHTAGCSDVIITLISGFLDPHIDARTMTWRTP